MRALSLLVLFATALSAAENPRFTFAAVGCMPYGEANWPGFRRVIDEINRRQPAFTVHCGDTKSGSLPPSDDFMHRILDAFNSFDGPLIYTPGDNEWTDVHRENNGRQDPLVWLAKVRALYFAEERSLGRAPIPLITQRTLPRYAKFVENARWSVGGVVFATIHMVGSSNNRQPEVPGAVEEFTERQTANIAWMKAAFAAARKDQAPGIALFFQADPFYQDYAKSGRHEGFKDFLDALEEQCLFFQKPVLLVHADEHRFRLDAGHRFDRSAAPVPNVTRVETFGDGDLHGILVLVDPASPQVFLPLPLLVPGNPLPALTDAPYSH